MMSLSRPGVCLPGSVTPWPHAAGSFTAGRRPKGLVLVFLHLRVPYYQDVHLIDGYLWVVLSDLVSFCVVDLVKD